MRKLLLLAAPLALASCNGLAVPPVTPGQVADRTVLDEQAALGVELAYKAWRLALETVVDSGLLRGEKAKQVAALDNRAYAAVKAVRSAYQAGNAASYTRAVKDARAAITAALDSVGSPQND